MLPQDRRLRLVRETGQEQLSALPLICLALVSALRGDEQTLRKRTAEIEEIAVAHPTVYADEAVHWAWGVFELEGGRPEAALAKLTKITQPDIRVISDLDCIQAAVLAKEERIAREWLRSQETFAAHSGTPWAQARVAHCRALMAARTELAYGIFLRRARRRINARTHLRTALDVFEGLKSTRWAERASLELRASGERRGVAIPRPSRS